MTRVKSLAPTATGSVLQEVAEDPVAQERHIKAMKSEYGKVHKNLVLAGELMQITFAGRRREITNGMHIKDVVKCYPFLQNYEEVILVHKMHKYMWPRLTKLHACTMC